MRLGDLTALYLACGVACAVALYRRSSEPGRPAWVTALVAVPLWPLWAPIAWTARQAPRESLHTAKIATQIEAALEEAVASVLGSPLERLLNRQSARDIVAHVERLATRREELLGLLRRDEFSKIEAERKLESLERAAAPPRIRASARLHLENVQRLHALADRDARALEELASLVAALRTQLVLMRMSGSSGEGVGDIVSELWARLESLGEVTEEALSLAQMETVA